MSSPRPIRREGGRLTALLFCIVLVPCVPAESATLPPGFSEARVATGLRNPTAMDFAPDGRLFACEKGGTVRVIRNGVLLATPFVTLPVNSVGERGVLGVAFDPDFDVNHHVYVYYTATTPYLHNRVSRFTANGDVAVPGSEVVIVALDPLSTATNHNGGAIHFGPDRRLYVAVGDNANGANSQSLATRHGKMLRLNRDGSIPVDNPFYGTAAGANRAIWALGLRNPFTFSFHAQTGRMFINDVGGSAWEEINEGIRGANYGWPATEGYTTNPAYVSPLYAYGHGAGPTTGCAITGAAFYDPEGFSFPAEYNGAYFFADYCSGWIRRFNPATNTASAFATGAGLVVDLKVSRDGQLYYIDLGAGSIYRIAYNQTAPAISVHPVSQTVREGASVTFSVTASGAAPLRYQWQRNGAPLSGATGSSLLLSSVSAADNGARFRVVVSNAFGSATSSEAVLTVTSNRAPTATITSPAAGTTYAGGQAISYSGAGSDPEDGALSPARLTWEVVFHHDTHTHPFIGPISGTAGGTFVIPTSGETSSNVWYRVRLTVRDSAGATHTAIRDVVPRIVRLTLASNPAGLQLTLDGQPVTAPVTASSVVGIVRRIGAPASQTAGGVTYQFASWSDGGAREHAIGTPAADTTYIATFSGGVTAGTGSGLRGEYFDNIDFTAPAGARVDPGVAFDWGAGAPLAGMGADTFSVRWTGRVQPRFSETYTFYTQSDDGVRLWVDGRLLIANWTDHALTENSGTIALVAGRTYDVRLEYYERGGRAAARLLWSSPSTPKAGVPPSQLYPTPASAVLRVNFQPAGAPVPAGHLVDAGAAFGARGNGQSYGWNANIAAHTRDRNSAASPDQRHDTLVHLQRPDNPAAVWEIALAAGTYDVRVVAGDPAYTDSVYRVQAETTLALAGTPSGVVRWFDATVTVTVSDGRLTIRSAPGAVNNKLCFVEIGRRP